MKLTVHVNPILSFLWFVSFFLNTSILSHLHYTVNAFAVGYAVTVFQSFFYILVPSGHKK